MRCVNASRDRVSLAAGGVCQRLVRLQARCQDETRIAARPELVARRFALCNEQPFYGLRRWTGLSYTRASIHDARRGRLPLRRDSSSHGAADDHENDPTHGANA